MAGALVALCAGPVVGQDAPTSPANILTIPDNVVILGASEPTRRPTAIVNGTVITGTDVDQRVALLIAASERGAPPPDEMQRLRLTVLRTLIDETLQIQESKALEVEVTKDEVDGAYARLANDRFNRTVEGMNAWLTQVGSSPESLHRQIEGELAWNRLLRRNVAPFVNVSASEVNETLQRIQAQRGTAEYRVAEIFLRSTPATQETVRANAQRIFDQLRDGGNFTELSRQYSQATTAARGGDLGWVTLERLQNPQLAEIVKEMQPSQMVGPVEIPGGFEILFLIDKRQVGMADQRDSILSLKQVAIEFPQGTTPEAARVRATEFQQAVQQIRGCGDVEATATRINAEVVDNDQVRVRDLPEQLQPLLLQLSIGQATPPFGSLQEGVRVLVLCGREEPTETGGPDAARVMATLQDDRIEKRAQRYLRDLRRDAVIEYN